MASQRLGSRGLAEQLQRLMIVTERGNSPPKSDFFLQILYDVFFKNLDECLYFLSLQPKEPFCINAIQTKQLQGLSDFGNTKFIC